LSAIVAGALGYFVLITPDNPMMRIFRGEISDIEANYLIGPYPVESDFERLKKNKVTTIVSLLDPALPYEKSLLAQEKILAEKHGMQLYNFPMASIFGQKLGNYYEANANAAAEKIAHTSGKVYIHCYLGIHRVAIVKGILESRNSRVGRYLLQEGERGKQALQLDSAESLYRKGNYVAAIAILEKLEAPQAPALLLHGWAAYHLGNIVLARKHFNAAALQLKDATEAAVGLGYCALKENDLTGAEQEFGRGLAAHPDDGAALNGMGIVRYRQGRPTEATQYLEKVLRLEPDNIEAKQLLQSIHSDS
jgi:tetratricopeptide (TPR) repeat protein